MKTVVSWPKIATHALLWSDSFIVFRKELAQLETLTSMRRNDDGSKAISPKKVMV